MATAIQHTALGINHGIVEGFANLRTAWRKHREYRRTVTELNALSTRELDDLGIARSAIRAIAHESVYGK